MDLTQEFRDHVTTRTIQECDDIEALKQLTLVLYKARNTAHTMLEQACLQQLRGAWRSRQSSPSASPSAEAGARLLATHYGLAPDRREAE